MSTTTEAFVGQVRTEWFQSLEALTFTFYVKNRQEGDVVVSSTATSLHVSIKLDANGRCYEYAVENLYAALKDGDVPTVSIRPVKVEVKVQKAAPYSWPVLEASASAVPPPAGASSASATAAPPSHKDLKYPNSKGKDWSSVELHEESEEKPEGNDALNKLFQQIYGDGSDEQRRAMIKSFTESGGTVLSTNWDDVGKKKVDAQPPSGMEAKSTS